MSCTSRVQPHQVARPILLAFAISACGGVSATDSTAADAGLGGAATASGGSSSATTQLGSGGASGTGAGGAAGGAGSCQDCLTVDALDWGMAGGMVAYAETSSILTCGKYSHQRDRFTNAPPVTCTQELLRCPDRTIDRIDRALGDPAFAAALRAHTLYGTDMRPVDGQVFHIAIGSDFIDVGSPCYAEPTTCATMPAAVIDLVTVLHSVDQTQLATPACTAVFGN